MHMIDGANVAATRPTVQPLGIPGWFKSPNPATGEPGTEVTPDFLNMLQAEFLAVLAEVDEEPSKGNDGQLLAAIQELIHRQIVPVGGVIVAFGSTPPEGYLELNGALISRSAYAALWAYAQGSGNIVDETTWNTRRGAFSTGDGATTFRLPDARGEFLRVWDHGRGVDVGRQMGTMQEDMFKAHTHTIPGYGGGSGYPDLPAGAKVQTNATGSTGGHETRPRNIPVMLCMRY